MLVEKDLYTGLQFKYKNENILYTINVEAQKVHWINSYNEYKDSRYNLKEMCRAINSNI